MNIDKGYLRGVLYVLIGTCSTLGAAFAGWEKTPPANWYAIVAVLLFTIVNAATALRAYVDQHMSRVEEEAQENDGTKSASENQL